MYSLKSSVSRASRSNGAYPLQAQTIVDVHQHGNNDLVIDKHWPLFLSRETSDLMVDFRVGNPSSSNAPSSSIVAQRGPLIIARHTAMLSLISARVSILSTLSYDARCTLILQEVLSAQ